MLAEPEGVREPEPRLLVDGLAGQGAEHVPVPDGRGDLAERAAYPLDRTDLETGPLLDEDHGRAGYAGGLQGTGERHRVDRVGHRPVVIEHAARYRDETAVRADQLEVPGARHVALLTRRRHNPGAPMTD
ncbi:hypothetical protein JCM9533A_63430 [Catenuloplanes niger JCM 9533]